MGRSPINISLSILTGEALSELITMLTIECKTVFLRPFGTKYRLLLSEKIIGSINLQHIWKS